MTRRVSQQVSEVTERRAVMLGRGPDGAWESRTLYLMLLAYRARALGLTGLQRTLEKLRKRHYQRDGLETLVSDSWSLVAPVTGLTGLTGEELAQVLCLVSAHLVSSTEGRAAL